MENPAIDLTLSIVGDFVPGTGTISKMLGEVVGFANAKISMHEKREGKDMN